MRRLQPFVPAAVLIVCLGVALAYGSPIAQWSARAERALLVPPLFILALFALFLPILASFLFQQTRLVLAAGLFSVACLLTEDLSLTLEGPSRLLLGPILSVEVALLLSLRDRGLLNRLGFVRLLLFAAPIAALVLLDARIASGWPFLQRNAAWLIHPMPGLNAPYATGIISLVALLAILRLRGAEYPLIAPSFAIALAAALIALDAPSPAWPDKAGPLVRPFGFMATGLSLLWCLYLLSWGRAYQDLLTGLSSRRALEERLERIMGAYSLVMVDVDRFKRFNDRYGHETGDDVLRLVAGILEKHGPGKAYRYGGEEFTLVCPGREAKDLKPDLERLRQRIAAAKLTLRGSSSGKRKGGKTSVTASMGVADRNDKRPTPAKVLKAADNALYRAKRTGRNRVCLAG